MSISYNLEKLANLHRTIDDLKCSGCGQGLQMEQPDQDGYIEQFKLLKIQEENELALKKKEEPELEAQRELFQRIKEQDTAELMDKKSQPVQMSSLEEYNELIEEKAFFRQVDEQHQEGRQKQVLCQRCVEIKKNNRFVIEESSKWEVGEEKSEQFIEKVIEQMQRRCLVLYVVDVMNLSQSLEKRVLERLLHSQMKVILVVNKADCLPNKTNHSRLRALINQSARLSPHLPPVFQHYLLASAKTGHNLPHLLKYLSQQKEESPPSQGKPRLYVVGSTNSGKSSLVNKLNQLGNKYKQTTPSSPDLLTESRLPGTTLQLTRVSNNLGFRLYDSPGFPVDNTGVSQQNVKLQQLLLIGKKVTPKSLFLGGLVHLQHLSGPQLEVSLLTSANVNLRSIPTQSANLLYFQHYNQQLSPVYHPDLTQVLFKKHTLSLTFDHQGVCLQEVEVANIGVINFSYNGKHKTSASLEMFLKDTQQIMVRSPLYPVSHTLKNNNTTQYKADTRLVRAFNKHK